MSHDELVEELARLKARERLGELTITPDERLARRVAELEAECERLREALRKIADQEGYPITDARAALALEPSACNCFPLAARGTPGDLEVYCPKCGKVFRHAERGGEHEHDN